MAAKTDLWGVIAPAQVRTPLAILREQAALLGEKTQNLVEATVATSVSGPQFIHRFNLVVPSMDDYTYELFTVMHGVGIYPITVHGANVVADYLGGDTLATEQEFIEWLRRELSSAGTKRIVSNLLAQVTS
jgi:hypothetical protein